MSWRGEVQKGSILEFPVLQMLAAAAKQRVGHLTVRCLGFAGSDEKEDTPLVDIAGAPHRFVLHVLTDKGDYLDWLNNALLCAGVVKPWGIRDLARRLAVHEDLLIGVDTNVLYSCILSEHLLDEFSRLAVRPYKEAVNWILLVIPGVVMNEIENAANQKKDGALIHSGRRGYRALQEIMVLHRTEGFQGLSVLVAGPTNPDQLRIAPDRATILNADSLMRDQFKTFLRGVDFHKGVFFLTMDKTNASLAQAEGLSAIRIQHPRRLRKGFEVKTPPEETALLGRVLYELAVEFGRIRVSWSERGQEHHVDLDGGWVWKGMEHWENWQLLCLGHDQGLPKALERYTKGRTDITKLKERWLDLHEEFAE
jgi:hypothetical protein